MNLYEIEFRENTAATKADNYMEVVQESRTLVTHVLAQNIHEAYDKVNVYKYHFVSLIKSQIANIKLGDT